MSSSSWGCELKCKSDRGRSNQGRVILFVRMWVEISRSAQIYTRRNRHPLREDVSWNVFYHGYKSPFYSHPLREDVSWNMSILSIFAGLTVILFVRMWVEIADSFCELIQPPSSSSWGCELKWLMAVFIESVVVILFVRMWVEILQSAAIPEYHKSSSSWGCELKYRVWCGYTHWNCHPLREDVSWNTFGLSSPFSYSVILFVRMWVEIGDSSFISYLCTVILFVRMWVEICITSTGYFSTEVILFVRMWVEMYLHWNAHFQKSSSSSWGCELKCR